MPACPHIGHTWNKGQVVWPLHPFQPLCAQAINCLCGHTLRTTSSIFTRSSGATQVRDTTADMPPAQCTAANAIASVDADDHELFTCKSRLLCTDAMPALSVMQIPPAI
eukprot:363634-Chlamydomonas_euryale.AAC.13